LLKKKRTESLSKRARTHTLSLSLSLSPLYVCDRGRFEEKVVDVLTLLLERESVLVVRVEGERKESFNISHKFFGTIFVTLSTSTMYLN